MAKLKIGNAVSESTLKINGDEIKYITLEFPTSLSGTQELREILPEELEFLKEAGKAIFIKIISQEGYSKYPINRYSLSNDGSIDLDFGFVGYYYSDEEGQVYIDSATLYTVSYAAEDNTVQVWEVEN